MRGDMLTEIAAKAYKDASKFVLIQRANPSLRDHPDKIYFDQVIYIPPAP
jgi:nucleoid-associated protein YgaU